MFSLKNTLICFFILFLSGCALRSNYIQKDFNASQIPEGHGAVFLSFTRYTKNALEDRCAFGHYAMSYRKPGEEIKRKLGVSFGQHPAFFVKCSIMDLSFPSKDIKEPNNQGVLFLKTLSAGEYEIINNTWSVQKWITPSVVNTYTYGPKEPFSIKFKVEPGKISYLGEFRHYDIVEKGWIEEKGIFGKIIKNLNQVGVITSVIDEYERDSEILKEKFPLMSPMLLINDTLIEGEGTEGHVSFGEVSVEELEAREEELRSKIKLYSWG